jgi:hypothetical protein
MNPLTQVTSDNLQKQSIILDDGTLFDLTLQFVPMQFGWFIQSLVYGEFTLQGFRVSTSPNMLRQYKNKLPFGLACFTKDNGEPTQQQDFSSGYATLYLLSAAEVALYEEILSGQVRA